MGAIKTTIAASGAVLEQNRTHPGIPDEDAISSCSESTSPMVLLYDSSKIEEKELSDSIIHDRGLEQDLIWFRLEISRGPSIPVVTKSV